MTKQIFVSVSVALVFAISAASGLADTISLSAINSTGQGSLASYIATDDLLQTSLSSVSVSESGEAYNSSVTALYNGSYGTNDVTDGDSSLSPNALTTVVFQLKTTDANSKNGYDVSKITCLSGYGADRTCQAYDVYVAKDINSTYNLLYSVSSSLANNTQASDTDVLVTAAGSSGGVIASNVGAIKIVFQDPVADNYVTVYRELDVIGTASAIPEPNTLALVAAGLIGLLAYAWKKGRVSDYCIC